MRVASRCFRLKGGALGLVAALLCIATVSFWVLGPIFGVLALVMITLAYREKEFGLGVADPAPDVARR